VVCHRGEQGRSNVDRWSARRSACLPAPLSQIGTSPVSAEKQNAATKLAAALVLLGEPGEPLARLRAPEQRAADDLQAQDRLYALEDRQHLGIDDIAADRVFLGVTPAAVQ
jgi:hypothetical protein